MAEQKQKQRTTGTKQTDTSDAKGLSPERQAEVDKALKEAEELLDEIDEILEMVGTEVATNFIQKGGQ